jgi:hypothetical protein
LVAPVVSDVGARFRPFLGGAIIDRRVACKSLREIGWLERQLGRASQVPGGGAGASAGVGGAGGGSGEVVRSAGEELLAGGGGVVVAEFCRRRIGFAAAHKAGPEKSNHRDGQYVSHFCHHVNIMPLLAT